MRSFDESLVPTQNLNIHFDSESIVNTSVTGLKTGKFDILSSQDANGTLEVELVVTSRFYEEYIESKNVEDFSAACPTSILQSNYCKIESVQRFEIEIIPVNDPPFISGEPQKIARIGHLYKFTPSVLDIDSSPLIFSLEGAPAWMELNTETGEISGIPIEHNGFTESIKLKVSDGEYISELPDFNLFIKRDMSFIHTDMLGSPVVETDIKGDIK